MSASSWSDVTLGDVCELRYGKSLPKATRSGQGYAVFGSNGEVGRHELSLTDGTTIIVGRKGSFGEVTYSADPCWPIDTTYFVDDTSTEADLRWLYYRMKALPLTDLNRSAAIPGLNRDDAYAQRFPLPPIEEQRRIAAVLDAADALRTKRRQALAKLGTLTQAIFIDMFGDPVTNDRGWPCKPLGDVCKKIQIGPFGSLLHKSDYVTGGMPVVNPMHLVNGRVTPHADQSVPDAVLTRLVQYQLQPDDVVMGRRGEMGRVAVIGDREAGYVCGSGSLYLRPAPDQIVPDFLSAALSSSRGRRELENSSQGVTMPNLNSTIVENFELGVPPLSLQRRYAASLGRGKDLRDDIHRHSANLDTLFASLQARAFRGEL